MLLTVQMVQVHQLGPDEREIRRPHKDYEQTFAYLQTRLAFRSFLRFGPLSVVALRTAIAGRAVTTIQARQADLSLLACSLHLKRAVCFIALVTLLALRTVCARRTKVTGLLTDTKEM